MKKLTKILAVAFIIAGFGAGSYYLVLYWPVKGGPYRNPNNWQLVFEEEFEGTSLNLSRWSHNYPEESYNGGHTHNHEGYMAPENVLIENGLLRLKAENRRHPDAPAPEESPWGWRDYNYTTAAITSHNKFNVTYGYIEGSFKMPASRGFWPAFWMLNDNGPWPPEIDVLETLMHDPTTLHVTFHYNPDGEDNHDSFGDKITNLPDLSQDFHTYGVEWTPDAISWYFDGVRVGRPYINKEYIAQCQEMYLLINLAIGGWEELPDESTIWPAYFECDWVRIWQLI
jgi:beta-glucanase (GH16 family)